MINKRCFLLTVAMAVGAGFVVSTHAQAPADHFDWAGFYVGAHGGYALGDSTVSTEASERLREGILRGDVLETTVSPDPDSVLGGFQAGANWLVEDFLVGVELDYSFANLTGSESAELDPFDIDLPYTKEARLKMTGFGSIRMRAGLTLDRLLIYGSGGLAIGRYEFGGSLLDTDGSPFFDGSSTDTLSGWTIGGGVEYALTDMLSIRGEYLYFDLGDKTIDLDPQMPIVSAGELRMKYDATGHILRAGINVHF